jgi:uncharacterized protein DUF4325
MAVQIHDLLRRRVLVTRASAHEIEPALEELAEAGRPEIELDFRGVEAVTPSFLDEILRIIETIFARGEWVVDIVILNPPTRLSSKFLAVGNSHGLAITDDGAGRWLVRPPDQDLSSIS